MRDVDEAVAGGDLGGGEARSLEFFFFKYKEKNEGGQEKT